MKSVNKITVLNIISTVLLQAIAFFTTPIFTRLQGADDYGMYAVFMSWVTILLCFLDLGVNACLGTGMYRYKEHYLRFRNNILLFGTIISLIFCFLGMAFYKPLQALTDYPAYVMALIFLSAFSRYVVNYIQCACVYEKRAWLNFGISVSLAFLTTAGSVYLISCGRFAVKYIGRAVGTTGVYAVFAVILWIAFFTEKPVRLEKHYCRFALMVGFPTIFHALAHNILSQSDRLMMRRMGVSEAEIGIYSLFYTLTAVLSTLLGALNTSWCPFYYDDLDAENWDRLKMRCSHYIELFSVLTAGFLLLAREAAYLLSSREFWGGMDVIPFIVCAVYFTFLYEFPVNFEFFHRKTRIIAVGSISAAGVNILLNALWIPIGGMYAAAAATAVSYAALAVFHFVIASNFKDVRFHMKLSDFRPGICTLACGCVMFYLLADYWIVRFVLAGLLAAAELHRMVKRKSVF